MPEFRGTLDIIKENNQDWYEIKSEFEIELIIERIIPANRKFPLQVRVHPENTQILRMVMREYPLQILTNRWDEAQAEITKVEKLKTVLSKLEYVEPSKANFTGELYPFQKEGLDFLTKCDGISLITDEMGLGKTWEALAFLSTRSDAFPAVVIAPLVTLTNWKRESEKLLRLDKSVNTQQKIDQTENKIPIVEIIRDGKLGNLPPADIYIINYDLMTKRVKNILDVNPRSFIADECHALRNNDTKRYSACKALAYHPTVKYRLGLSGTPLYNRGFEMFNIIEVLKSGLLGDSGEFYRRYCDRWNSGMTKDDAKSGLSEFLKKSIMLRRRKSEVLPDLPEKIKMKQTIDIDRAKYHGELKKLYKEIDLIREQMLSGTLTEDSKKDGLFAVNKKIREMTIAERQIAGLAKAPFVVKYLLEMFEDYEEEKFVVFCHHLSVHKILYDALWKFNPVQIIGGQTDKERQGAIDSFQNDKKTRVIICGLRAGSLGINLTSAAYVIFAELDWSPSIHAQAEDRLHRIGQKNKVFAHYLEGAGTFDEILSQVLMRKTYVISDALGEKMEKLNNKMALEYLEEKFKISDSAKLSKIFKKDFSG